MLPTARVDIVRRNVTLRDAPTAPVEAVYSGVLYDALGLDELDPAARRRARAWIVVISALWGAVRPGDRIPPYRLNTQGLLVRRIVIDGIDADRPEELAEALSEHFKVELVQPDRPGQSWRLDVVEPLA